MEVCSLGYFWQFVELLVRKNSIGYLFVTIFFNFVVILSDKGTLLDELEDS